MFALTNHAFHCIFSLDFLITFVTSAVALFDFPYLSVKLISVDSELASLIPLCESCLTINCDRNKHNQAEKQKTQAAIIVLIVIRDYFVSESVSAWLGEYREIMFITHTMKVLKKYVLRLGLEDFIATRKTYSVMFKLGYNNPVLFHKGKIRL